MAKGKLYEVKNEGQLRWSFFSEGMVYLAGFSQRPAAESYGAMVGYDISEPELISASVFDQVSTATNDKIFNIRPNSAIPRNLAVPASLPVEPRAPAGAPKVGGRMGRRF